MSDETDVEVDFESESREPDGATLWEVETNSHMVIFPNHPGVVAAEFGVELLRVDKKTGAVHGCGPDKPWFELGKNKLKVVE